MVEFVDIMDPNLFAAIVGALIGVAGTVLLYHLGKKRMKVTYEKSSVSTMINVHDEIKDKIKVEYEGKPINKVYSFNVKIKNTGNTEVEKLPVLFEFDSNTKILGINFETIPNREFYIEKKETDKESDIKYEIEFLNPKDQVFFNILTADNRSESLSLYAHVKGLKFYESRIITTKEVARELTRKWMDNMVQIYFPW